MGEVFRQMDDTGFQPDMEKNEMLLMEVTSIVVNSVKWMPKRIAMPSPTYPGDLSEKQNTIGFDRLG